MLFTIDPFINFKYKMLPLLDSYLKDPSEKTEKEIQATIKKAKKINAKNWLSFENGLLKYTCCNETIKQPEHLKQYYSKFLQKAIELEIQRQVFF